MSRSGVVKLQGTAGSVERCRRDRISMKKEAGTALDAGQKISRCGVCGSGFWNCARSVARVRRWMSSSKLNRSWIVVLVSFDKDSKVI